MTWLMATMEGTVEPASMLCSQVGVHSIVPPLMRAKIQMQTGALLTALRIGLLTTDAFDDASVGARLLDQALRLHSIRRDERCDQAVCRRLAFIYGTAGHHSAVDDDAHDALHELFGPASVTMLKHLAKCAIAGRLVAGDGSDTYFPHLDRLRFPITFLHGAHNRVWLPESTARSYDLLTTTFGPELYRRVVLDGHGHQDSFMGASAAQAGFPVVVDHLVRAGA